MAPCTSCGEACASHLPRDITRYSFISVPFCSFDEGDFRSQRNGGFVELLAQEADLTARIQLPEGVTQQDGARAGGYFGGIAIELTVTDGAGRIENHQGSCAWEFGKVAQGCAGGNLHDDFHGKFLVARGHSVVMRGGQISSNPPPARRWQ